MRTHDMKNKIIRLLGFEPVNVQTHSLDYQNNLFSTNNLIQRVVNVDELVNNLLDNSQIKNSILTDKEDIKLYKSPMTIADIVNRRKGSVVKKAIYVVHPDNKNHIYKYHNEKAMWQMKTKSVIAYNEKIPSNTILVITLDKPFKKYLRIKNVNITQYFLAGDYDYINNIRTPLFSHKTPNQMFKEELESHKHIDPDLRIKKNTKQSKKLFLQKFDDNNISMFGGVEDNNFQERKALDTISTKLDLYNRVLADLKNTLSRISKNNPRLADELNNKFDIGGFEALLKQNKDTIKELYSEFE